MNPFGDDEDDINVKQLVQSHFEVRIVIINKTNIGSKQKKMLNKFRVC